MRTMLVKVKKVLFHNPENGYHVFSAVVFKRKSDGRRQETKETVTCAGHFIVLYAGDFFEIQANKFEHTLYGERYNIIQSRRAEPGTIEEITKFLTRHGQGIGMVRAKKLTDKYGLDTLRMISRDIHTLDFLALPDEAKKSLYQDVHDNAIFEELLIFLQLHQMDNFYATEIYEKYGEESVNKLCDNPYAPYLDRIWPFGISEELHAALGYEYNTKERITYASLAAIEWDSENGGNLFLPEESLGQVIVSFLSACRSPYSKSTVFTEEEVKEAKENLVQMNLIEIDNHSIYLAHNRKDECSIARNLRRLMTEPKRIAFQSGHINKYLTMYLSQSGVSLAPEQESSVMTALTAPISIITGGPGTGKTHTIKTIISAIQYLEPEADIRICAPTGKAAIRAEEMSGLPASTIHRMLGLRFFNQFVQPESLECDFLIVDEFSMVDAFLCNRLFTAAASFTRIILVGDANQLPSVGPGLILRDLISSGVVPVVTLKHVFRQANKSLIIRNANMLIGSGGKVNQDFEYSAGKDGDFYFIEAQSPTDIRTKIQSSIRKLNQKYGMPVSEIQILTPVKKGQLGTESLNCLFQEVFIPSGSAPAATDLEREFRKGDKVIHTRNNPTLDVYNGEVGIVSDVNCMTDNMLTVSYPDGKYVNYSITDMCELDLAYALTVHKSQGSEFQAVIIPVHRTVRRGISLPVIYTALTRAKKMVIFIGNKSELFAGLNNNKSISERRSHLIDRIQKLWTP